MLVSLTNSIPSSVYVMEVNKDLSPEEVVEGRQSLESVYEK